MIDDDIGQILVNLDRSPNVMREGDTLVTLHYRVDIGGDGYWFGTFGKLISLYGQSLPDLVENALARSRRK